jgi:tungstate transport system substrate-binding protein
MSKKLLSWVIVLTIIAGFAQTQIPPIEVLAAGVLPSFIPGAVCPTGSNPYSVAATDLNGDARPDLIVSNNGSYTVSVLLNNGSGTFAPKVDYPTGTSPRSVAATDLNGDSRPDIVVANEGSNTVSVLLNNGSGTFAPKVDYPTGTGPRSVAATDLNGDARPDIVVANEDGNTVSVLLNAAVNLSLIPASSNVIVGSTFDIVIQADAGAIGVVGVDAFLNFDPAKLTVVDMDGGTAGIQITPGTALNTVLTNSSDNALGRITFGAGKVSSPYPTGWFSVATIRFRALTATTPTTHIFFSTIGAMKTSVTDGFSDFTGTLTAASVQVIPLGANVNISVSLQGGSRPDSGWIVPLTVKFFTPGADVMAATPIYTFNLTTAKSGGYAMAQCTGVIPGNYDITSVSEHTLLNVKRNVIILATSNMVNMETLPEGNANNDDRVNILDFGLLVVSYGRSKGQSGYNAMADYDRNDNVNIFDFGLLATNYLKIAPIELDVDQSKIIILSTTTSTKDSGMLDVLIPIFQQQTGYVVFPIAVGSGAAMAMGQRGEADVMLVHAPASEVTFMKDGYGINRQLIMHNDYIIVGPAADPAKLKGTKIAVDAFKKMADSNSVFISRGDNSGTNQTELKIWQAANINPEGQSWYTKAGTGMGATLNIASEKAAYTMTDRATYLANKQNLALDTLVEGDTLLFNIYHAIQVNPEKWPTINSYGAKAFVDFMISPDIQKLIGQFGVEKYGQPLFFPDYGKKESDLGSV